LPGIAALIALFFSFQSIRATNAQLLIAEQGQITDRYNAAITNLGSSSVDVRLGGIYALQRIMQDSPRDQPTVIAVLCAFVRDHASTTNSRASHLRARPQTSPTPSQPPTDIQAVLTVVSSRNTFHDGSTTVVDFTGAQLDGAQLAHAQFANANLSNVQLRANLLEANLINADLTNADLVRAYLLGANLRGAGLPYANLTQANLSGADLVHSELGHAQLSDAALRYADLSRADVEGANLTHAFLYSAILSRANLSHAKFTGANLTGANLTGANLTGANLTGANLTGANLTGANLTGAKWSESVPPPSGWVRGPSSGRLKRSATAS
jgi:uncharacterized protein YjbI with pentapeptide repeats